MSKYPQVLTITDWHQYIEHVIGFECSSPITNNYLYRGQADSKWELQPSLTRFAKLYELGASQYHEIEKATLQDFRKDAHLYLPANKVHSRDDLVAWWVLMQQYGAPTRVLDWTVSAYVALYFAVEKEPDKDGAVWVFRSDSLNKHHQEVFGRIKPPPIEEQTVLPGSPWVG